MNYSGMYHRITTYGIFRSFSLVGGAWVSVAKALTLVLVKDSPQIV